MKKRKVQSLSPATDDLRERVSCVSVSGINSARALLSVISTISLRDGFLEQEQSIQNLSLNGQGEVGITNTPLELRPYQFLIIPLATSQPQPHP